jgi:hypothetical protein
MFIRIALVTLLPICYSFRSTVDHRDISIIDSSNCTWTDWSECKLESDSRCTRTRTLQVLPLDNQRDEVPGKTPCSGQGGSIESSGCNDGLCPNWQVGNWTDCSSTCNTTLRPWEGFQRRDVLCQDISGVLYRADVCENLYGVTLKPEEEKPCECSHKLKPFDPYAVNYTPVGV